MDSRTCASSSWTGSEPCRATRIDQPRLILVSSRCWPRFCWRRRRANRPTCPTPLGSTRTWKGRCAHSSATATALTDWRRISPRRPHAPLRRPAPDLPAGGQFAGYDILRELGRGGMGVVYLARQRGANRLVALKLIRRDRLEHLNPDQRRQWLSRFRMEGQAAARVADARVVTVYEVGAHDGRPFYSMRYVEGRSLEETVKAGPLPNRRAALLMEQVARAVDAIHERGVFAPRPQAGQHSDRRAGPSVRDRLRSGEMVGSRRKSDADGRNARLGAVRIPRAGGRLQQGNCGRRRVRPRSDALRPPHGAAAVPRRDRGRGLAPGEIPRADAAPPFESRRRSRPEHHRPPVPGEGAWPTVPQRGVDGG